MEITPYDNIPDEMKSYRQWLCWRYEYRDGSDKPTKVPYDPRTARMASVSDPMTWCTFEEAKVAAPLAYNGIGFVLTKNDPYTFIDLDDTQGNQVNYERQLKIYQTFDSYSERSPSGKGLHIICKAQIPSGRRRASVEIYSSERYMTMTGDVYHNQAIQERHELAQILWAEMAAGGVSAIYDGNCPQTKDDDEVIRQALSAVNGDKFRLLLDGQWNVIYPSQSEADFAFIDIIAFYTQNKAQIARIFQRSALGQRAKATRPDYLNRMIHRAFDRLLPPVDIVLVQEKWEAVKAGFITNISGGTSPVVTDPMETSPAIRKMKEFWKPKAITPPPGLMGEIAQFIYRAAPRPVAEMALIGAIGLMAGICGRAYNISGTGLNIYALLLAPTGTGKESIASGINKLITACSLPVPAATQFLGAVDMASGQAILKHLPEKPCFVSIIGEFGLKMQQLSNPYATNSEAMVKKVLLDLYNKSGATDLIGATIHADKSKDTPVVRSPNMSLIGEATPSTFYASLDEGLIRDGLLPRFLIIEYSGKRVRLNKEHKSVAPSDGLVSRLADMMCNSIALQAENRVIDVKCDEAAAEFLDNLDMMADDIINETTTDSIRELWNRAHLKTLKLAALVAVGCNTFNPIITLEIAQWAYNVVAIDVLGIVNRFTEGTIGKGTEETYQGAAVIKTCMEYMIRPHNELISYGSIEKMHKDKVIPMVFLARRLNKNKMFVRDKRGSTEALKRAIQGLVDSGDLQELGKNQIIENYGYKGKAYVLARPENLPATMNVEI